MDTTSNIQTRERGILSLRNVLLIAIAARLLLPLLAYMSTGGRPLFEGRDTNSYIQPAISLMSEGKFTRWGDPEILRTPGYPLLLIPGIASGHVELVTIALQIALSVLTVFLVYRIAMLLFERTEIAILSAILYALEPISILYSSRLMSETLFTTLITLFLYFILTYWKKGSLVHLVLSAIALTAATYVRPISYYLPLLVFIILFVWYLVSRRQNSKRFVHLVVFLVTSVGLISIWQVRNRIETGYPGFSAAAEHSLYFWDAASVLAIEEDVSLDEMQTRMGLSNWEIYFENFPDQQGWERSEIFRSLGTEGLAIILSRPGIYFGLVVSGAFRTLLDPAATEYLRMFRLYPEVGGLVDSFVDRGLVTTIGFVFEERPLVFWTNLFLIPVVVSYYLLAIFGFVQSRLVPFMPTILFISVAAYFIILSAAGIGTSRARHPIMPMICVFAGYGLFRALSSARTRRSLHQAKLIPTS